MGEKSILYTKYVSEEAEQGIKKFEYKGGSDSILYQYIWSPLTNFMVENIVPGWVAPNLITLTGYSFLIFTHLVIVYNSPDANTQMETWVYCLGGFALFVYQVLDNLDGKQARKTRNSSPLGMLFDHGCDSSTSWICGISELIILGTGNNSLSYYAIIIANYLGFYNAMWAQYHCGVFRLGRVNAIDEGLVLAWGLYFFTAWVGNQFWQQMAWGLRYTDWFTYFLIFLSVSQSIDFAYQTIKNRGKKSLYQIFFNQGVSLVLLATCFIIERYSPTQIVNTRYWYPILVTLGCIWSKITLHIQIAHLGNEEKEYQQFRKSFVFICLAFVLNIAAHYFNGKVIVDEKILTLILLAYSLYNYIHTCVCVSLQLSELLQIPILRIKPLNKKQQ